MPIISVIENENNRWKGNTEKKTKTEKNKGEKSYSEKVGANRLYCAYKLNAY